MSKNELIAKIEALSEWENIIAEAQAEAEALRDSIKEEMLNNNTEEMEVGTYIIRWTSVLSNRFDKTENIAVTIKANVPDVLTISDVELSIIIGNLLDNAIEACRTVTEERFIRIFISMKGNMLYFSMLNSAGTKKTKIGSLFTTHKDGVHGFGLRRAEAILEDHGGWVKYNSEDGAFTSEFLVPAIK